MRIYQKKKGIDNYEVFIILMGYIAKYLLFNIYFVNMGLFSYVK